MAEVIGQPPVEYQSVSQPAEGQATAWTERSQFGEPEPDAGPGVAQTLVAEFIGTFALVAVGVTTWYWMFPDLLAVGLASGLTVAVLVTAFNRLGSGQFNPAITLGLLLGGRMKASRAMMIIPVQIISAVLACFVLSNFLGTNEKINWIKTGPINEETGQVTATMKSPVEAATPGVPARYEIPEPIGQVAPREVPNSQRVSVVKAIVIEVMLTFFWGLAVFAGLSRENRPLAGLFVGAAVTVGILSAGVLTEAVMNPVRAFGPALVSGQWDFQMVYWLGPLLGGALAGVICGRFLFRDDDGAVA